MHVGDRVVKRRAARKQSDLRRGDCCINDLQITRTKREGMKTQTVTIDQTRRQGEEREKGDDERDGRLEEGHEAK